MVVYINWDGFAWYYYTLANSGCECAAPVINGLAKEGVLFANAYSGIPSITNPMQAAILTGAWPAVTGNCYRYYDKNRNTVVQLKRENKAETIAEAALRQGLGTVSIHQFLLENRGTFPGSTANPYIQVGKHADYAARFNAAIKIVKGWRTENEAARVRLSRLPGFLAIYMDDLDGIGHNDWFAYGVAAAGIEEKRLKNIMARLKRMDAKLGEFVCACKETGLNEEMSFLLTADHGMAPYGRQGRSSGEYERSKLPDLVKTIKDTGYKVEVLEEGESAGVDTDIVLVTAGLQVQLTFARGWSGSDADKIIHALEKKPYAGIILKRDELAKRGAMEGFADLLVSPKVPYCFKPDSRVHRAGGQHDSLDETAQHVFALMWGNGVKKGLVFNERVYITDFTNTMSALLGMDAPRDATGRIIKNALTINEIKE